MKSVTQLAFTAAEKYTGEVLALRERLDFVAEQDDYALLRDLLREYIQQAGQLQTALQEALAKVVTELELEQEQYGERWWQQKQQQLEETCKDDPEQGQLTWLQTYAAALIDGEIAICRKLVDQPFSNQNTDVLTIFRRGTQAIEDQSYFQALYMLSCLLQTFEQESSQPRLDKSSRATLLVFTGRIFLYKASQNSVAYQFFEDARKLAPGDGLVYAALGDYYRAQQDADQAQSQYQKAIELSPGQPAGYVGMGLLSEGRASWDEAADWYDVAIEAVRGQKNIGASLSKLLAPVSGNLYLQLARALQRKDPEQALRAVERALALGIQSDGQEPERFGYRLKAEILEQLGRAAAAAEAYYEAGQRFALQNSADQKKQIQIALELLTRGLTCNPRNIDLHWSLTDTLRVASSQEEPPYVDAKFIEDSLTAWEAASKLEQPPGYLPWMYAERALINEQRTRLPGLDRWALFWENVVYLERALLLSEKDPQYWAYLGAYHRELQMDACALQATAKAIEYEPQNITFLQERAAILVNVGDFALAERVIEQMRRPEPNAWADAVKAFILLHTEQYSNALELLWPMVDQRPDEMWFRSLLALCYRALGDQDHAREQYQWLWDRYDEHDVANRDYFESAAYHLGKIEDAIALLLRMREEPLSMVDACWDLGLCYLIQGDINLGEASLKQSIALTRNVRQLGNLLQLDLDDLATSTAGLPHCPQVREVVARIKQEIATRKQQIVQQGQPDPIKESQQVLARYPRTAGEINWIWIGAQAGLARLALVENRWGEAAAAYQLLQQEGERFSEARYGLEKIFDTLLADGDTRLKEGTPRAALEQFEYIQELHLLLEDSKRQARLYTRLAYLHFIQPDTASARPYFAQAIQFYHQSDAKSPGSRLGETCRPLLADAAHYWSLADDWQTWIDDPATDETLRVEIAAALRSLANYLDELYQLAGDYSESAEWIPLVKPVVLELGLDLLTGVMDEKEWPLIETYLPELRQCLNEQMGVTIPGVQVRDNLSLPSNGYLFMLDEIPFAQGAVPPDMRYSPASPQALQALGIPAEALIPITHPLTEKLGCWVKPEYWNLLTSHDIELWSEPLVFVAHHLQAFLFRHLADLLDTEVVEQLLAEWGKHEGAPLLRALALPDAGARYHLAEVLRALVKEFVPLTRWQDILRCILEIDFPDNSIDLALRGTRLRLKDLLPANDPGTPRFVLPAELEDTMSQGNIETIQSAFFSFLRSIEKEAAPRNWHVGLVASDYRFRSAARYFLDNLFPGLTNTVTLSREELLSPEELVAVAAEEDEKETKGAQTDV